MDKIQQEKIISMYEKRRPIEWIAKETGLSRDKIVNFLKEEKLWTGHKSLLNYFDEFFFDKIDTGEKAYWLGFIYADGYLDNRNGVGIELDVKDKNHLEKFKKALQAELNVKIYYKNSTYGPQTNCRFMVHSKHMSSILLGYYKNIHKTFEECKSFILKKSFLIKLMIIISFLMKKIMIQLFQVLLLLFMIMIVMFMQLNLLILKKVNL